MGICVGGGLISQRARLCANDERARGRLTKDRGAKVSFTPTNRTFARNGSNIWSCLRGSSFNAWYASGNYGFFGSYSMFRAHQAVPLSLVKLA